MKIIRRSAISTLLQEFLETTEFTEPEPYKILFKEYATKKLSEPDLYDWEEMYATIDLM